MTKAQSSKTNKNICRRTLLVAVAVIMSLTATCQTFTQHVQEHNYGEGVVTIHQDAAIDRLVNGSHTTAKAATPTATATATAHTATATHATPTKPASPPTPPKTAKTATAPKQPSNTKPRPQSDTVATSSSDTVTAQTDTAATAPTPPRHGYKTTGYRVQAFAGGNTRSDRQKAERTGNALRQLFPGEDVYVRFYSPRWVCRMGNYRTYEEAHEKMLTVRKLGYETATIVKGKIIIYD